MRISCCSSDVCSSDLLQPGEPLRLERLKQDLKIGFTPLREALMRLSSEGLVLAEEQRGFRVAPATLADLEDIMTSRAEIEALALQRAIRHSVRAEVRDSVRHTV